LIVAGGETSGACVQALGIAQMQIGPQIAPGVPWTYCVPPPSALPALPALPAPPGGRASLGAARRLAASGMHITLKSGNFGGNDFFTDAFKMLA
jgi:uncharacterized protein YgbK (DUF1537 family)